MLYITLLRIFSNHNYDVYDEYVKVEYSSKNRTKTGVAIWFQLVQL
jgi:hypothetical protein